jgi:hypothetical protein
MNDDMKVAFIHYHLKTGGVTTVLKQQLTALPDQWPALVLTGMPPQASFPAPWEHIPELAYSSDYKGRFEPDHVARKILDTIHARFNGSCDVLHIHNPTLAKNQQFIGILNSLQQNGANLLLQIHDFAEDGRPRAFFKEGYPADCHYSVINRRDLNILQNAGLDARGLHLMTNMVAFPAQSPETGEGTEPRVLYPVRAIRRKNIGEAILLSLFLGDQVRLSITLPPNSEADIRSYNDWKAFVKEQQLKVDFDRGLNVDFISNVTSAISLLTTSITEGFGFSFLEPWLFGKVLWGRKLPDICNDFENNGIQLQHLYSRLLVPVDWIGLQQYRKKWMDSVRFACKLLNHHIDGESIQHSFDSITRDGNIDFGLLNEGSQKNVLSALLEDQKKYDRLLRLNPFLSNPGQVQNGHDLIRHNQKAIRDSYGQEEYSRTLRTIYDRVASTTVRQKLDKQSLVSAFMDLENFSLLKWSDYVE